jgi:hypothetical protein
MISKIDEVFRKVLNDREIFWHKIEIFNEKEWTELQQIFDDYIKNNKKDSKDLVKRKIDEKIKFIQRRNIRDEDKNKILKLLAALKNSVDEKPNLLYELLNTLNSYALVKCNLPSSRSMEIFGKVIERYDISTVKHFFITKISKEGNPHVRKALKKVLEYAEELYISGVSPEKIAYFVRKLNSLEKYWEVIE